jgi:hypothetical protein
MGVKLVNALEAITTTGTGSGGTINIDATTQSLVYATANATGNFILNVRANSTTPLNTLMAVGETYTFVYMNTNGGTAYYATAIQVDGVAITPRWSGGTAPTSGNASSIDVYTYTVIKTGSAAFTILAQQTKFA